MRVLAVMFCSVLVAGCAQTRWVSGDPAVGPEMAAADGAQCQYQAHLATPGGSTGPGVGNAVADGIQQGMRLAELQRMCMEAKGYVRVRVN